MSSVRSRQTLVSAILGVAAVVVTLFAAAPPGAAENDDGDQLTVTLRGYSSVSSGGQHTCGIQNGALLCWGRNVWGQVGNGDRSEVVPTPRQVGASTAWTSVSAGGATTCGIRGQAGRLYCWGLNNRGQLGDRSRSVRLRPHRVAGTGWQQVSTGWYHTCAIRAGGRLFCWGDNQYGELGQGDTRQSLARHRVTGVWRQVVAEGWTTCGIRATGALRCWGRNLLGQVGDGSWSDRRRPSLVGGAKMNWRDVDLSWTHGCGVRGNRTVWCWGRNDQGAVGDGSTDARNRPTRVRGTLKATAVSTFEGGSCLLNPNQRVYCWGDNRYGQVGGDREVYVGPHRRGTRVSTLSSGWMHTCGIGRSDLVCWGADGQGQLARSTAQGLRATAPLTERGAPLEFRIASLNALGEHHSGPYRDADRFGPSRLRAEWTVRAMTNQDVDLVALQEASGGQISTIVAAGDGRLAAYPDPATSRLSTESTLVWDRTRFTALRKRTIRTMFITRKLPRPYVKFRDNLTGRKFWVLAIHNAGWDMQRQRNQAMRAQIAKVRELEATGLPVFYLGDFNEKRTALCKVLRRTGLDSASGGRLRKDGTCLTPRTMRVDWIFGSATGDWNDFTFSKSPMVRLTTDHWMPLVSVRVP